METLKFRIGDKVRVKSLEWYNENKDILGDIISDEQYIFLDRMSKHCGKVFEITEVYQIYYRTDDNDYIWQDWMLENEPVTEEKQEVEQQKKIDMETKEMTKEEVFAYLKGAKIMCTSVEEAQKVQEKLFELGIKWKERGKTIIENVFLFQIRENYLKYNSNIENWMRSEDKRIYPSEILAIQLKEEKPKFDPQTLMPYDRVLVRNFEHEVWVARFFDYCECDFYYTTSSACSWKYCVPYCDETKHLHRTCDDAPEFYRI